MNYATRLGSDAKSILAVIIFMITLATLSTTVLAQSDRATLTGTVHDQSGAVVPGAAVKAIQVNTNLERSTQTSTEGEYTIPQLPIGTYRVEIQAAGFKTLIRNAVDLAAGVTSRIDGALSPGDISDSVNVTADAALLQTESAKVNTQISQKFIEDLPLVVSGQMRSPLDLALIAPEAKGGAVSNNITIGGGQEGGWDLTVDGVSATPAAPFEQRLWTMINSPSVDAITEFNIETNGFKAEFGHAGGGLISFVTKSGTNEFHGTIYEFLRNEFFDANNFFNNAAGRKRPTLRQHDFGFTVGGPVFLPRFGEGGPSLYNGRDKTFFFVSYEGFRNTVSDPITFRTIPLDEMYRGDFSNWRDANGRQIPIYDPATTRPNPNGTGFIRDPFPGNRIPQERFSNIAKNVVQYATMRPNVTGSDGRFFPTRNFVAPNAVRQEPWNKFDAKADHQLTVNDRIGFLFHYGETLVVPVGDVIGNGFPYPLVTFRDEDTHTYVYRGNWDKVFSPTVVNRLNVGWNNWWQVRASRTRDEGWGTKIGVKNVPAPDALFPAMGMEGYETFGYAEYGGSANKTFAIGDDLTVIRGSHSFKFGFNFQEDHYNGYGLHNGAGFYNFGRGPTGDPSGQVPDSGNGFATFLLGEVGSASMQTPRFVSDIWKYYSGYAQDDWRVTPRLTINYGLRYEYTPPTTEGRFPDGYSNFDPNLPNPGADGRPGAMVFAGFGEDAYGNKRIGSRTLYPGWPWGFGPRLSFAYSLNDKTVIRAGAARSFGSVKNTGGSSHFQGFFQARDFNQLTALSLSNPAGSAFQLDNGLPDWERPPFLRSTLQNNSNVNYWQPYDSGRLPEYLSFNFNVQREIGGNMVAELGYNASLGRHLPSGLVNLNQVNPQYFFDFLARYRAEGVADPVKAASDLMNVRMDSPEARRFGIPFPYPSFSGSRQVFQALRPFPQYNDINTGGDGGDRSGNSTYHALAVTLEKRLSSGLIFLNSYVFSKHFADSETANAGGANRMDQYNRRLDKTLSSRDQTHVFKFNYSYELPFGPGRRFLREGVLAHAIGGWRIAATHYYASGVPIGIGPGYGFLPTAGNRLTILDYENWRTPIKGEKFDPFVDRWFDCTQFQRVQQSSTAPLLNACGQPSTGAVKAYVARDRFGNATTRNPKVRSPWFFNENISLARTFQFTENMRIDLRGEVFNLFNRVRWADPNTDINSPDFGLVRAQANAPRQMQFALKFYF